MHGKKVQLRITWLNPFQEMLTSEMEFPAFWGQDRVLTYAIFLLFFSLGVSTKPPDPFNLPSFLISAQELKKLFMTCFCVMGSW